MDFDELQKSWKEQPINVPENTAGLRKELDQKWRKQQRGVLISNTFTTIGFVGVIVLFCKIYSSFHEGHTMAFGASLVFMTLLMLVYLGVIWKGTAMKRIDIATAGNAYIDKYLQTLYWRRKTLTTYTWVYSVLLWLGLMFYLHDVLAGGGFWLQAGAYAATTGYIFFMVGVATRKKQRRKIAEIDELIKHLKKMKEE